MPQLSDFNEAEELTTQDFHSETGAVKPLVNEATSTNMAAQAAVLSAPTDVERNFLKSEGELREGNINTADQVIKDFDQANAVRDTEVVREMLSDPDLNIDQKTAAVKAVGTGKFFDSPQERIAFSSKLEDSEGRDNDETEFTRVDTGPIFKEVNEYNAIVQQQINMINETAGSSSLGMVGDFAKLLIPFYEQGKHAFLVDEITDATGEGKLTSIGKALTLMGSSKQDMRDTIQQMPIEQRKKMAQVILDYARESSGPHALDPNKITTMGSLAAMLETGGYSGTDKFIDNLTSVIDDVGIIAWAAKPILGVVSGVNVIGKLSKTSKAGKATIKRYEDSIRKVNQPEKVAVVTETIEEAVEGLKAGTKQEDIRTYVNTKLVDEITKVLDEQVPSSVRVDVGKVVDEATKDISATSDTKKIVEDIYRGTDASLSRRIVAEEVTEASLDASKIVRSNATRDAVKGEVSPTSVSQVYKDSNPRKARELSKTAALDETGRIAKAGYGTNKTEAMAQDFLPEVHKVNETVKNKVDMDAHTIKDVKENTGRIDLTDTEKADIRDAVTEDIWRDVNGLVPRRSMMTIGGEKIQSSINKIGTGLRLDMIYGPRDGGFKRADQALNQVKVGLRKYGVLEEEIELLIRSTEGYRPVTEADDLSKNGNYLVRVKYDYEFNAADVRNFDKLDGGGVGASVFRLFDARIPGTTGKAGGLTQHIVPSSVTVDKVLLDAASVASDRTAIISRNLQEVAAGYVRHYEKLDSTQKYLVDTYIVEANAKRLAFDPAKLEARGMSENAIDAVRGFKKVMDTSYYLDNMDLTKTLNSQGYELIVDAKGETSIIGKLLGNPKSIKGDSRVLNPETGSIETMPRSKIDELYEKGGSLAKSRGPIEVGDDFVELVIVKQDPSVYSKRIRNEDFLLNYIDGYYKVNYNDPYFITKQMTAKDGTTYEKAIQTAPSRKAAEGTIERLRSGDEAGSYRFRGDIKRDSAQYEEMQWSTTMSMGRSSQKIRGQRLTSTDTVGPDLNHAHVETPEESLLQTIQSVSNRVSFRDFLESSKGRFLKQFEHLLEKQNGQVKWPESVNLIGIKNAEAPIMDVKNAIAMWRYIDSIETGYVDTLSDVSKTFFKHMSDVAGRAGFGWVEKAGRQAEQFDINNFARRKSFRMLLSSNPVRQILVQPSQAIPVIGSLNPTFLPRVAFQLAFISNLKRGGDVSSWFKVMAERMTGLSLDQAREMAKHYKASGIEEKVNANTFMREDLSSLVNRTTLDKINAAVDKPLDLAQKWGYETGENILMTMVWLSEYDLLRKAGATFDAATLDRLSAKTRHLTGNMNRAGDMPYNQNAFSGLLQFFGTPHKIFSQIFMGHNGLTKAERSKMAAGYLLTYGTGRGAFTDQVFSQFFPDMDPVARADIENGLSQLALNKALSQIYGEDVNVATSDSFRIGIEQPNIFRMWSDLMELNITKMLENTPGGGLVTKLEDKFIPQMMRMFTAPRDKTVEEIALTGKAFLEMFSGGSNFFKAQYILKTGQAMSTSGKVTDSSVNYMEGLMRIGGFATMDEVHRYAGNEKQYKNSRAPYDDVKEWLKQANQRMAMKGISNQDVGYAMEIMREGQRVWGGEPFYQKILVSELRRATADPKVVIWKKMLTQAGFLEKDEYDDIVKTYGLSEKDTNNLLEMGNMLRGNK